MFHAAPRHCWVLACACSTDTRVHFCTCLVSSVKPARLGLVLTCLKVVVENRGIETHTPEYMMTVKEGLRVVVG